jgi:hypothetical protein
MRHCANLDLPTATGRCESEQVKRCMDLENYMHWLHLEPTHKVVTYLQTATKQIEIIKTQPRLCVLFCDVF